MGARVREIAEDDVDRVIKIFRAVYGREACRLLVIDSGDFHRLMDREPAIGQKVMRNLAHTLSTRPREADGRLEWMSECDLT